MDKETEITMIKMCVKYTEQVMLQVLDLLETDKDKLLRVAWAFSLQGSNQGFVITALSHDEKGATLEIETEEEFNKRNKVKT
jgi:hypothetical protein